VKDLYANDSDFGKVWDSYSKHAFGNYYKHGFLFDEDMTKSKGKDPLEGLGGPMTRARARKAKEALQ